MKITCGDVLFVPLKELVEESIESCEVYEVDPKKLPEGINVQDNIERLISLVKKYLDVIFSCLPILPL